MQTDWIEHHGTGAPDLPPDMIVEMRFRSGNTLELAWDAFHADRPNDSNWVHDNDPLDIVAYRVVLHV